MQPDGRVAHLELVLCKSVDTYVRVKKNQNQVVWKWVKVVRPAGAASAAAQRHFLDRQQYSPQGGWGWGGGGVVGLQVDELLQSPTEHTSRLISPSQSAVACS